MAFNQQMLRPVNNYFNKRSYTLYLYKTTDTLDQVVTPGYFSPNDWIQFIEGDIIQAQTGNGYAFFEVTPDPSTVIQIPVPGQITDPTLHTTDFTVTSVFDRYRTDTTAGQITVTIEPNFPISDSFRVQDVGASWTLSEPLVVDFIASGYLFQGVSQNYTGSIPNDGATFIHVSPSVGFELL